jgi:hypothetical protein
MPVLRALRTFTDARSRATAALRTRSHRRPAEETSAADRLSVPTMRTVATAVAIASVVAALGLRPDAPAEPERLAWRDGARWAPHEWQSGEWRELPQPDGGVVWTENDPLTFQTAGVDRGSRILVLPPGFEDARARDAAASTDGRRIAFGVWTKDGLAVLASEDGFGTVFVAGLLRPPTPASDVTGIALIDGGWRLEVWSYEAPLDPEYWSPWQSLRALVWRGAPVPQLPAGRYAFASTDFGQTWAGPFRLGPD